MSKRKIDETMTEARIARGKRVRTVTHEEPAPAAEEQPPVEAKAEDPKPQRGKKEAAEPRPKAGPKPSKEELVVFAFRLTEKERNLIHRAAGPAKASRYVRTLAVAAARGDEAAVKEILRAGSNTVA